MEGSHGGRRKVELGLADEYVEKGSGGGERCCCLGVLARVLEMGEVAPG